MNLTKMGEFLKELRKEKNMTQEQLAEMLNVSGRTVSRWETGSNMPDLDILIELADFYDVDIRELIDGERKSEKMDAETKDTLKKVADYAGEEKKRLSKKMADMTFNVLIIVVGLLVVRYSGLADKFQAYEYFTEFTWGLVLAALVLNILYCLGILDIFREIKVKMFKKNR